MIHFRTSTNQIGIVLTHRTKEETKINLAIQLDLQPEDVTIISRREYNKLVKEVTS
ncbi:hypothetical protein [Alkalibaculum sporogenes]|uniref:hypothetical protein n=1 Tax=Alkalibaculum sporogenes TaxID=2655001 RepID=UPI00187B271A|nr:hypothetical protein [Alkalibaculum sporogenes]